MMRGGWTKRRHPAASARGDQSCTAASGAPPCAIMASVTTRPNGHRWIQFIGPSGTRQTLRLGRCSHYDASVIKRHIEQILTSRRLHQPVPPESRMWISGLPYELAERLQACGVIECVPETTVGGLCEHFLSRMDGAKASSLAAYSMCTDMLIRHFGTACLLVRIGSEEARSFVSWAKIQGSKAGQPLSPGTLSTRVSHCRSIFGLAVTKRWMESNPLSGIESGSPTNPDRMAFVPQDHVLRVMRYLKRDESLILVLARWGGLRIPSEVLPLQWGDIDWDAGTMRVTCVKTTKHPQCRTRLVPLFPMLREHLGRAWDTAGTSVDVLRRRESAGAGLHRKVCVAAARAGLQPWPRLFQNLRSSRETELVNSFPAHVVAGWLGHSQRIQARHYLQITDEHMASALAEAKPERD